MIYDSNNFQSKHYQDQLAYPHSIPNFPHVTFLIKFTYLNSSVFDIRLISEQNVNSRFAGSSLMTRHSARPMSIVTPNQPPFFQFWFSWL